MGYYTRYRLETDDTIFGSETISHFRKDNESARHALTERGESTDGTKWYSHQEDLEKFSLKYPNTLFILYGEGEESGDIWKLYVKGGKSFKAKAILTFEEYSEDKLE